VCASRRHQDRGRARNATVCDGEDAQTFAEFFDKYLALHSPEMAAATIVDGVSDGRARVMATAVRRLFPWANKR
jgi:hypothetical protein